MLVFLFGILACALVIYAVPPYHLEAVRLLSYSECDTPLPYSIGSLDARFGLSRDGALEDSMAASGIWSNAEGKNLFTYAPGTKLTVNFVYDQRQALDTAINQLNSHLMQNSTALNQQIADYEAQVVSFQKRFDAFNTTVDNYNREGGAPPKVYDDLIRQQKELNTEEAALNERAKQLNLSEIDYNAGVSVLNKDINQFHNALLQKPEEGVYNGENNTITIYFADNRKELVHTLAHEFGHALGMEHVRDKDAIMYPFTTDTMQPTPDDMAELAYVCREQSLIIHRLQEFAVWLATEIRNIRQNFAK